MEKQRLLDGGLVAVGPHRSDFVECSDGSVIMRSDAEYVDCRGVVHRDEDALCDANDEIVKEVLDAEDAYCGEYVESEDYGACYAHLVREGYHNWGGPIGYWLDDNHTYGSGWNRRPTYNGKMRDMLIEAIGQPVYDYDDFECHYQRDEYGCYAGDGCAIDSFEVGEYETQIDLADREELKALDESGDLEGCLARYDGNLYIRCNDRYDRESKKRVCTGYVEHGSFYGYSTGWGRWHFVVPTDSMDEYLAKAIVEYCERVDG